MRRFIRSRRRGKPITQNVKAIEEQFMRDLQQQANALLLQLGLEFNKTLQTQITQATQGIVAGNPAGGIDLGAAVGGTGGPQGLIGSAGQLLTTSVRYLLSRPKTNRNTAETSRSIDANASFRLSQAQASAEMQAALGKGNKNS